MNKLGILLVHGFSGRSQDLLYLADRLKAVFGPDCVHLMHLPGHANDETIDRFDQDRLLSSISDALEQLRKSSESLVVLGHSTGGNLALASLARKAISPDLLVLAATPFRIDLDYLDRWQKHQQQRQDLSLTTLSGLIKLVNSVADQDFIPDCKSLLFQGGEDDLVPQQVAQRWEHHLNGDVFTVGFPGNGHQLFCEEGGAVASEVLIQEISTLLSRNEERLKCFAERLVEAEPEAAQYVSTNREQLSSLAMSPSGRRLMGEAVRMTEIVPWNPVFANIEITTFCNFACRHCARTVLRPDEEMMSMELFKQVLDRLPSAYRVTLVGLGEPLLHPQLKELILLAKARGHRVGIVTNGQLLNAQCSADLLDAGLDSITFSLDTVDSKLSSELRSGSELGEIEANIKVFCKRAEKLSRPISRAVFSAVSSASLDGLEALINRVSTLGVHVLMLSDLNFIYNQEESLSAAVNETREKQIRHDVAHGFSKGLPVLGVRALEDFGLAQVYREALLLPVQQLYRRSEQHRHCYSPWQTLSVNVSGDVCLCDCQPEEKIGSLQRHSLTSIWNGAAMRDQRRRMLSAEPSRECLVCPRF